MNHRPRILFGIRISTMRFLRHVSISPLSNLVSQSKPKPVHKFSYEKANNVRMNSGDLETPDLTTNFGDYKRISYKLKVSEDEAQKIPAILALHARLNLSPNFKKSTLVRALTSKMKNNEYVDNHQMALFGSSMLSYYTTEYLITTYPRLPIGILKTATDSYVGDYSLHDVAKNVWGIEEDSGTNLEKYLSKEPKLFRFGKLRYDRQAQEVEAGITKYSISSETSLSAATAYANSVRAIVAGVFAADGERATKDFIYKHILSRNVDIPSMLGFEEPGKLLAKLLKTKNMEPPTIRLISETGRQSSSPTFIVGCFSGDNLLGEGQGTSLKEARIRSCVSALKAFYLYKPLEPRVPSDEGFKPLFVDEGELFY
ncbi:hypothetical protein KL933_005325 [Ogataea haglerorum]|uniref:Large ribosomal subunit protein mL44 n=1 Tax=Ogataea haglerorum TaxID=1937702 RepID=A0AAN6D1G8_9ASCO|nr:hypothetical protein KL950_005333 [Ogataea haglerorum]KAG7723850.1 hypothetical protein KL933_005325 [Ogataea haglerorum]KAG7733372.1 hypothetical protein KL932_005301 [Ogataea haglerorum]KAG7735867.1 hypothetical protein KL923_005291 [Ogataea haglerorum]KAG7753607.1 hypothetical protein KL947_005284 [Ogataea haglerorum]